MSNANDSNAPTLRSDRALASLTEVEHQDTKDETAKKYSVNEIVIKHGQPAFPSIHRLQGQGMLHPIQQELD